MNSDLISIVVPIYNMEKYLDKCVNSIISQTYKNIEIILVDDGSTDLSYDICEKYKKLDNRIKVYHKTNGGLSDAKNFGIKHASGKYIGFVDSDDWIEPTMYEILYKNIKEKNADIAICGRYIDYENGKSFEWKNESYLEMSNIEALIILNSFKNIDMSSCDKLFLTELYKDIEFPFGKKCEDAYTTYKLFAKANKVINVPECLYHYYQRSGSISRNTTINMDYIYAAEEQIEYFNKNIEKYIYIAYTNYLFSLKSCFQFALDKNINLPDVYKIRYQETKKIKGIIKNVLNNKYISKKKKLTFIIYIYIPSVYKLLLKFKKRWLEYD